MRIPAGSSRQTAATASGANTSTGSSNTASGSSQDEGGPR
jgi:hypothetical protein